DFHVTGVQTCALPISVASQQEPAKPEPERERPSPDEVKAMLADFRLKMAEKDTFRDIRAKIRPSPQARVDETGISAEARALMAKTGRATRRAACSARG